MFVKMLLAFVVSICLAGGAVYYGMPDFENSKIAQQTPSTSKPQKYLDKFIKKPPVTKPEKKEEEPVVEKEVTQTIAEITKPETTKTPKNIPELRTNHNDLRDVLDQIMSQAERIEAPNLKDQAYLGITNFATQYGNFDAANIAMIKIKQKELRDTARGNIAIFMARTGMVAEAFKKVDEVEIETLQDVMRLQVIEAIVMPNQMPPAIQQ